MAKKKKQTSIFELIILLIFNLIALLLRLILILFDWITIYTSGYKKKSGNGFFKTYFNKGNYGEFLLYRKLARHYPKKQLFTNLYLDGKNTDKTEIDVLSISKYGIFVFEMKNYSGLIYGNENDSHWTQVLNFFTRNRFYNPIRQNYAHMKALGAYLSIEESQIIPIVVFSKRSKFKKVTINKSTNLIKLSKVTKLMNKYYKRGETLFTENQIEEMSLKLINASNMGEEVKKSHIEQVKLLVEKNNKV